MSDPSKTAYGEFSPGAPPELRAFSFLIGKWQGKGRTRLPDGSAAEFPVTWIGRCILEGTAIADECHAPAPDGSPYLGISFRQYDPARKVWVVEFLNVSGSFLRKQVGANRSNWTFRLDISGDDGRSWTEGQMEMTFERID